MPTDPSLILNFAQNLPNLAPDPSKLLAQQLSADRLTVFAQQQEGQKALKDLYANPQNLDQQGRPTPQAMSRLMAAAPTEGLDLTQALTRDSTATAQLALMRAKEGDETIKQRYQIGLAADTAYRQAIADKLPPEQARKVGQDAFTEARDAAAPFLGPDVMNTIPTNYDPSRVARGLSAYQQLVLGPKDQLEMAKTATDIEKSQAETEKARADTAAIPEKQNLAREKLDLEEGKPVSGAPPTPGSAGTPQISGDDYLQTLDPTRKSQVKALSEGRMSFPSGFALRSPYWQQLLQEVSQYDPSFDAVNYNARAKTRAAFTSGIEARNITSLNTVIGHLDNLKKLGNALKNGDIPAFNWLSNAIATETGKPQVTNFEEAKQAVTDELERTFRGTSGSVTGIRGWAEKLTPNASPAQQKGAWQTLGNLLDSRIDALGDTYSRGMGRTTDGLTLLSPTSQAKYADLTGRVPDVKTVGPTGKENITPADAGAPAAPQAAPVGVPSRPAAVPPDAKLQHNPSTGAYRWLAPDGKAYDAQGAPM